MSKISIKMSNEVVTS